MGSRLLALASLAGTVGGCAFDRSGLGALPGDGGGGADDADPTVADAGPDAPPPVPPCPSDPDLVACYRFEVDGEPSQPHDDSAGGNDGSSSNVTFPAGPDGRGTAMAFTAASVALVPDSASLDVAAPAITLEAWVLVSSLPPVGGRAGLLDNNGQYGLFLAPDGAVRCSISSATAIGLAIPVGVWTHVACTYDGQRIQLYQDGVAGAFVLTQVPMTTTGVDGLGLGQNVPADDHLDGALDDVRVWRVALDAAEVCASGGPPEGCVLPSMLRRRPPAR